MGVLSSVEPGAFAVSYSLTKDLLKGVHGRLAGGANILFIFREYLSRTPVTLFQRF